jgi:hypothetical protein
MHSKLKSFPFHSDIECISKKLKRRKKKPNREKVPITNPEIIFKNNLGRRNE